MKDCEKVLDLLNAYIDGELNESDAELVRAHIENCPDCQKAYNELTKLTKIFEEATEEAPEELAVSVMEKVKAEKALAAKRLKFTRIFGGVAIAAVISLTVLASPAILLIVGGGAKASDMAEALAPSDNKAEADRYYSDASGLAPECVIDEASKDGSLLDDLLNGVKPETDGAEAETEEVTVSQGKKYAAYRADGSKAVIIFTEDLAILDGKEYKYTAKGGKYLIDMGDRTAIFEMVEGEEIYFKETGETND